MQPINDNRLQHQVMPAQQKISGHRETSPYAAKTNPPGNTSTFPKDVVTLSKDESSVADSPVIKKPSIPVTIAEKKALRESFSVYV